MWGWVRTGCELDSCWIDIQGKVGWVGSDLTNVCGLWKLEVYLLESKNMLDGGWGI
jgi:hypothetical protein